jgi:hypothetical protein
MGYGHGHRDVTVQRLPGCCWYACDTLSDARGYVGPTRKRSGPTILMFQSCCAYGMQRKDRSYGGSFVCLLVRYAPSLEVAVDKVVASAKTNKSAPNITSRHSTRGTRLLTTRLFSHTSKSLHACRRESLSSSQMFMLGVRGGRRYRNFRMRPQR